MGLILVEGDKIVRKKIKSYRAKRKWKKTEKKKFYNKKGGKGKYYK